MQSLARRHPERASRLLFFNCPTHGVGARWRDPGHINQIWYQTFHQMPYAAQIVGASRENCRAHIGHFLRHWSHRKDAFDGVLERWVDNFMRPGVLQGGFNFYISQNAPRLAVMAGTAPKPDKIRVPARVVWGRHDPILKAEWADVLPEAFRRRLGRHRRGLRPFRALRKPGPCRPRKSPPSSHERKSDMKRLSPCPPVSLPGERAARSGRTARSGGGRA